MAGLTAGGLGALVGSPADLTLIRMQADNTLPVASRRNYKGVGDAMARPQSVPRRLCLLHWAAALTFCCMTSRPVMPFPAAQPVWKT